MTAETTPKQAVYVRWREQVTPVAPAAAAASHVADRSGQGLHPGPRDRSGALHAASVLAATGKNLFVARADVGPWATVDLSGQPDDDNPYLVVDPVTAEDAEAEIERYEMAAVEGALGLDRKQADLIADTVTLMRRVAVAARAPASLAAAIEALGERVEREHAEVRIAEALVARNSLRERGWYDRHDWPSLQNDLVPRVDELAGWLDRTARRTAETRVRQANPTVSLEAYEKQNPGKLAALHHALFKAELKTWLEIWIPRADFAEVTGFGEAGRPWTDSALKRCAAVLEARVRAEKAAAAAAEAAGDEED